MSNEPKWTDAQCILWKGHRIYWHGTTNKKCRAYTDDNAVSTTKRVEAKTLLWELVEACNISLPASFSQRNTHTDKVASAVFDALRPASNSASEQNAEEIARIAKQLGGFPKMFAIHGWPSAGEHLAQIAGSLIKERYGSVKGFVTFWDNAFAK